MAAQWMCADANKDSSRTNICSFLRDKSFAFPPFTLSLSLSGFSLSLLFYSAFLLPLTTPKSSVHPSVEMDRLTGGHLLLFRFLTIIYLSFSVSFSFSLFYGRFSLNFIGGRQHERSLMCCSVYLLSPLNISVTDLFHFLFIYLFILRNGNK